MNYKEYLEDFDENSKKILLFSLDEIIPVQRLQNKDYGNFQNVMVGNDSPDYRSPFHDYRETPLGYSYLTDDPVSGFPFTGTNDKGEKGYEYRAEVLPCENGSQVLESYKSNPREKQSLFLFYEKPDPNKSNFAGDFYIAKMGEYFVNLFKRFPEPLPSSIGGKFFKNITSMEEEAGYLAQLAYTYEHDKIDATLVHQALMREYQFYTGDKRFEEIIGNISSIPADAIGWCAEKLEALKPTEKNYNPEARDYSPLIPIIGGISVPVNMNKAAQFFENLRDNPFVQGVEAAFSEVWSIVQEAANKVKNASVDHLPDSFKNLVKKITGVVNSIKDFLSQVKDQVADLAEKGLAFLQLLNAFSCGVINGLVGLVQCILYILEFLLQPTTTFSYTQYLERRDLLEKAEDVIDWVSENVPKFLQGIKDLFKASGDLTLSDLEGILDKMKEYFGNISRYTVAFYVGVVVFEVLINILLLIFTEGAGNVVKGVTYVQKIASMLKVLARETVSVVTMGVTDLLAFLTKFIVSFGKACAKGFRGFIKWIEDLLTGAKSGAKADDLGMTAQEIEEVILAGKKPQSISNILSNVRIGFKKLGIEIVAKADGYLLKWKEKPIFKGDFKEVNAFWNKILKPKLGTGTGGVLKYLEVLSRNMVAQEHSMSCAAACIRQLAKDNGIEMTESAIRKLAGTTEELGTTDLGMVLALEDVFKGKNIEALSYFRNTDEAMPDILKDISKEGSWLASIHPLNGQKHAVIVDKIIDNKVYIRDPWPIEGIGNGNGVEAIVNLDDFVYSWLKAGANKYKVK
ncbi:Peptidase C39 family protein [Elizabethkingia miricola]|nr:Peptidase C39 family protein [Elizabethkingia miricola]